MSFESLLSASARIKDHFIITAHAWKGETHSDILSKGIDILKNDGYQDAYDMYDRYRSIMSSAVCAPDRRDDIDKGKGFHYYNARNVMGEKLEASSSGYYRSGKNLLASSSYARSARTIFEDNYQLALSFFAMGGDKNIEMSMRFAARCVHMICDICCPPHTTDLTLSSVNGRKHLRFEYRASDIFSMFKSEHGESEIYDEYQRCRTAGENFNLLADLSASFYDTVVNTELVYGLDAVIEQMLMLAQKHAAAFLLKFYNDTSSGADAILPTEVYRLVNAEYKGALVCDKAFPSGFAISQNENSSGSSLIKLSVNRSGYYEIRMLESGEHLVMAKNKSQRAKSYGFKIAKTSNGYRLLSSVSGYTKALAASKSGAVGMAKYDPDSKQQHWILEKVTL